jgi:hypothetical protein
MQRWTREYSLAVSQRRQPGCNQSGGFLCILMGVHCLGGGIGLSNCSGESENEIKKQQYDCVDLVPNLDDRRHNRRVQVLSGVSYAIAYTDRRVPKLYDELMEADRQSSSADGAAETRNSWP